MNAAPACARRAFPMPSNWRQICAASPPRQHRHEPQKTHACTRMQRTRTHAWNAHVRGAHQLGCVPQAQVRGAREGERVRRAGQAPARQVRLRHAARDAHAAAEHILFRKCDFGSQFKRDLALMMTQKRTSTSVRSECVLATASQGASESASWSSRKSFCAPVVNTAAEGADGCASEQHCAHMQAL